MGRTLVQVISEKYNPDNFPYCRGPGAGVVIRTSPQGSPVKGQIFQINLYVKSAIHSETTVQLPDLTILNYLNSISVNISFFSSLLGHISVEIMN